MNNVSFHTECTHKKNGSQFQFTPIHLDHNRKPTKKKREEKTKQNNDTSIVFKSEEETTTLNRVYERICSENSHKMRTVASKLWSCKHFKSKRSTVILHSTLTVCVSGISYSTYLSQHYFFFPQKFQTKCLASRSFFVRFYLYLFVNTCASRQKNLR